MQGEPVHRRIRQEADDELSALNKRRGGNAAPLWREAEVLSLLHAERYEGEPAAPVVAQCGFAVWFCSVVLQCGFAVWFCSVVLQCGFAVWFHSVVPQCSSAVWCTRQCPRRARPCPL